MSKKVPLTDQPCNFEWKLQAMLDRLKSLRKVLTQLNPIGRSKRLAPFFPTWVVAYRIRLLYWLYSRSKLRKKLRAENPQLIGLFDELDKYGCATVRNFLSPDQYAEVFAGSIGELSKATENLSNGSIYKSAEFKINQYDDRTKTKLQTKFETVYKLLCYIDGYKIARNRFGPTLQATRELPEVIGDNCEAHVDCFQPSGKGFLYLGDVEAEDSPFCYLKGSNERAEWRVELEKLGHKTSGNGSWRATLLERTFDEDKLINATGSQGDLIISDVSGFHYRKPGTAKEFRNIIYFCGTSSRDNPFLKLIFG